jgi:hypothetical protein
VPVAPFFLEDRWIAAPSNGADIFSKNLYADIFIYQNLYAVFPSISIGFD